MKIIILILLTLSSAILYASGGDGCESCKKTTIKPNDSVENGFMKLATDMETKRADAEIKKMCSSFHRARSFAINEPEYEPHYLLKKATANFYSISQDSKNINKKVETFWNKYNDRFICKFPKGGVGKRLKSRQNGIHFAKLVIHHKSSPDLFVRYLLAKRNGMKINVNAIEIHNNKEETILDYIDHVLDDPEAPFRYNVKRLKRLQKRLIRKHGGKRARELLKLKIQN